MTIKELIAELERLVEKHGDMDVMFSDTYLTIDPWCMVLPEPISIG